MVAILAGQKARGHDVAAIIPSLDGTIAPQLAALGIPCYVGPSNLFSAGSLLARGVALLKLAWFLRRLRPDVVHTHIFEAVISGRFAAWLADVPALFSAYAGPLTLELPLFRLFEQNTLFADTKTIASSTATYELLQQLGAAKEKLELVFYAIDYTAHDPALANGARVREEWGIAPETPVIGKVAYFYPPLPKQAGIDEILSSRGLKGHDVLLRAVPRVLEHFPDARFVMVGKAWSREGEVLLASLHELAASLGIEHAVLFPGERRDVPDVLASFDISVHCSLTDNLGGTVESLLMERPMIVSSIRGFADTVLHEETGLVVPVDDPQALADAIIRLLRDRELARTLGQRGRERMLGGFMIEHTVENLEAILQRTDARAEDHYRIGTTLARMCALPFRVLPIFRDMRQIFGRPPIMQDLPGILSRRIARIFGRPATET